LSVDLICYRRQPNLVLHHTAFFPCAILRKPCSLLRDQPHRLADGNGGAEHMKHLKSKNRVEPLWDWRGWEGASGLELDVWAISSSTSVSHSPAKDRNVYIF